MASTTILSDNGVSSGSAGIKTTGGNDGVLALQTTTSGGTATTAVTISNTQNVGIGTASPGAKLNLTSTGNTTADGVRLTLGSEARSHNIYSALSTGRDLTIAPYRALTINTGSGTAEGVLALNAYEYTTFGTGSSYTERARIDSSGNLLVGTTTAGAGAGFATKLAVDAGAADTSLFKTSGGSSSAPIRSWNASTTTDGQFIAFATEASYTTRGTITYNRGAGLVAYNTTSDYRAKAVTGSVQNALSKLASLKPSTGRMNGAEFEIDFFVAHELQEVVPSAVTGEKDAVNEDGTPNYQMVDKSALIPLLTAAIQEQQALITTLTERITALEAK